MGKLHRGGSDARARGVHEHCLAPCDLGLGDHGVVRGDEHLGHAARRDEVEVVGHERAVRGRDREQLGLATATGDPEDALPSAGGRPLHTQCDDLAR